MRLRDRSQAGERLAGKLADLAGRSDVLVLAIPRGGVVVAHPIARALLAPLDICLTHKLGAPGNPELAIGAITQRGPIVLDQELVEELGVPAAFIEAEAGRQRRELERRARAYRGDTPNAALDIAGKTVIVVDDGLATGSTMVATLQALNAQAPAALIVAVPVAPLHAIRRVDSLATRVECLDIPFPFWAVGAFYNDFSQVSDAEVMALIRQAHQSLASLAPD